ncbi:YHS domain-containing (seleno)protein [Methylobacterium iners]|nr:YHS domain-containing (seleno)protein [Methylobacterium iners]
MMNLEDGNMWLTRRRCLILAGVALLPFDRSQAGTPPRIPGSLALNGFDAVSYFLAAGGDPVPGRPQFELDWKGRVWRFASAANREAFRPYPDGYAPRLGGYDPLGVAEGRLVDTDPMVFALMPGPAARRLYLFRNEANRDAAAKRPALIAQAEALWPALGGLTDASLAEQATSEQR